MEVSSCARCGHRRAEHDPDGCVAAVCTDPGNDQGPDAQPPSYDRCWCPEFRYAMEVDD